MIPLQLGYCKKCGKERLIANRKLSLCTVHESQRKQKRYAARAKEKRNNNNGSPTYLDLHKGKTGKKNKRSPIKFASVKRLRELAEYRKVRDEWLNRIENLFCKVQSPVCTHYTNAPHHSKGRVGSKLLEVKYWIPSCNPCNNWIESHPKEATRMGVRFSRLN